MAFGRKTQAQAELAESQSAQIQELSAENATLASNLELVQESLADLQLALDDIGWRPLGSEVDMEQMPRWTIMNVARVTRALAIINPLLARAIAVRTAYLFGNGIDFEGTDAENDFFKQANIKKWLTTDKAWQEMERAADTDGNFFVLCQKKRKKGRPRAGITAGTKLDIMRVPFRQVVGFVTNPDNIEDVWFYKRQWTTRVSNGDGIVDEQVNTVYYPSVDYDLDNGKPTEFAEGKVDWSCAMAHYAPNKQIGWVWGVPLLWGAMFWSKAHKEFLELNLQLTKAYAKFAFKATAQNTTQTKAVAAKMANAPSTDPVTGLPNAYGATFASNGINLQSIGKPGGAVDFNGGRVLASYVSAAMNVPMQDLLPDAADANRAGAETVAGSNEKVLKAEQNAYKLFFESIFEWFGLDVQVKFPPMTEDYLYRRVQAIQQAATLYQFSDREIRLLLLDAFDVEWPEDVPGEEELKNQLISVNGTEQQQKQQAEQAKMQADAQIAQAKAMGQAKPAGIKKPASSAPSYGDNGHRDAEGQHRYSNGNNG